MRRFIFNMFIALLPALSYLFLECLHFCSLYFDIFFMIIYKNNRTKLEHTFKGAEEAVL